MKNMVEKLSFVLTKISESFAKNTALNIISSSFMMILPVVLVGSISALLKGIDFGGYQTWLTGSGIQFYNILDTIYQFTVGYIALYIVFCIGYQFSNRYGLSNQSIAIGLFCIISFLIITPYTPADVKTFAPAMLPFTWLGASGMFMAIIVGFMVGLIFKFCLKHNIRVKLPDSVPPAVSNQFSALIPGMFVIIIFALVNYIFALTPFLNAQDAIYSIIKIPLGYVSASIFGYFILIMFMYLLWFFGIHGGMTVGPIIMMVFMQLQMENLAAYQAHQQLPHLVIGTHITVGTGSLALLVAALIVCKSKTNQSISKLAIIPAFFGVDEPAYFGIPMILNPVFFLPWVVLIPALQVFGTYLLQIMKLVPYCNGMQMVGNTPFFIMNFFTYGWQGCIAGFVFFILAVLIYIPFVKIYDKQCLAKEVMNDN